VGEPGGGVDIHLLRRSHPDHASTGSIELGYPGSDCQCERRSSSLNSFATSLHRMKISQ
jgi:hypothetical protein